ARPPRPAFRSRPRRRPATRRPPYGTTKKPRMARPSCGAFHVRTVRVLQASSDSTSHTRASAARSSGTWVTRSVPPRRRAAAMMASTQARPALSTAVTPSRSRVSWRPARTQSRARRKASDTVSKTRAPASASVAGSGSLTRASGTARILLHLFQRLAALGFEVLDEAIQALLANRRIDLVAVVGDVGNALDDD